MREYLERRMGYGPQVAAERLRVADALEGLPALEAALDAGELSYSAPRCASCADPILAPASAVEDRGQSTTLASGMRTVGPGADVRICSQ